MAVKFKVPTSVQLMGKTIQVKRHPLKQAHAEYNRVDNIITVDTDCPDHLLEASFFHECVHAALWTSGVSMMLADDLEEAIRFSLENLTSIFGVKK